jgi:hypothetical protein
MSQTILRHANLAIILAAGLIAAGCGATVYSPAHPANPTAIYMADYGRHSSVFFPMEDSGFVEYSFGDWNFYAMGNSTNSDGFHALFWSCSATMARRYTHPEAGKAGPSPLFGPRVFQLTVGRSQMQAVRDKLELRWRSLIKTRIYNPYEDMEFVRDPIHYSWLYTCNDWTAQLLREMGCKVDGITTFSSFQPGDKANAAATPLPAQH